MKTFFVFVALIVPLVPKAHALQKSRKTRFNFFAAKTVILSLNLI